MRFNLGDIVQGKYATGKYEIVRLTKDAAYLHSIRRNCDAQRKVDRGALEQYWEITEDYKCNRSE